MTSASLLARVRIGAVVGGLAAALVLTGCGSGDGKGGDAAGGGGAASTPASTPTGTPSAAPSGGTGDSGGSGARGGTLEGSWLATTDGKTVALVITGGKAGLFDSGGNTCSGTAGDRTGMRMIALKCTDGNDDRGHGMVGSVTDTTLKVKWEGFGEETYTRSEDGRLPKGLPTNGLAS
ncbi:hypothetical protein GCM10018793_53260 [Streptomyces sulfonofaciens]|uniref:Lipoprotein n=1 Tax=Streptomyces sulfonofaciens TaxID=68272 RepID=A0A919L5B8_9ACTN|nr:hypothetical protein [Streptomyces sulfonofaciens]GHH85390.1 hypothetical protein GCM10018793_53260 [Streptomyces sulfonofaciens]